VLVLVLFAFALDPDRRILTQATPGLFWLAVLFSTLLALQRAFSVEAADGVGDALRLSGLDPAGIFLGKVAGIAVHLLALQVVLVAGRHRLLRLHPARVPCCWSPPAWPPPRAGGRGVASTACLSAGHAGARHAAAAAHPAGGGTGADRGHPGLRRRLRPTSGSRVAWFGLLAVFALLYLAIGIFAFEPLLEES
jgi:heme exporter protein B